jgi:peptidoglycan/xylan/chitin deacetylase (PgdA/CDA1 family)
VFTNLARVALLLCPCFALDLLPGSDLGFPLALVTALLLPLIGAFSPRSGFLARPINRIANVERQLALTFDDGPDPEHTPIILRLLRQHRQRATFFLIGERVARHPALARAIVAEGHEVANHTLTHPWYFVLQLPRKIKRDLRETNDLFQRLLGVRPRFFRAPATALSPWLHEGLKDAGLWLVGHSIRVYDRNRRVPNRWILQRLLRALEPGAILLMHDSAHGAFRPPALEFLPELLSAMDSRGLSSVTLSELMIHDRALADVDQDAIGGPPPPAARPAKPAAAIGRAVA